MPSYWNPFSNKTNEDILGAFDRAFATNPTIAKQEDWFNSQNSMYGGGQDAYQNMLDTTSNRFLQELGVEIGDQQARRNAMQNALNLRNKAIANSAISGNLSGTGTMRDALSQYGGDWLRTGQTQTSPFKDTFATIQGNKAVASQSGDAGKAYTEFINDKNTQRALETEALSQLSGPYRNILANQFNQASINAGGADPMRGYYGTLADYSPFQNGNVIGSPNFQPVTPAPLPAPPTNIGTPVAPPPDPTPTPPALTGNDGSLTIQPVGTGTPLGGGSSPYTPAFDRNAAQSQVAQAFRSVMGTDADPAQLKYWTDRAEAWGLDEALRRIGDNDATKAIQYYRQNGGPTTPPPIQGSGDINGLSNYAVWLIDAGLLHPANQQTWMMNMANLYRNASL